MKPTQRLDHLSGTDAFSDEAYQIATELERVTVECEQAKADRNKAGVIERRKYLPIISDLKRQVEELKRQSSYQLEELNLIASALGTNEGHSSVDHINQLREQVEKLKARLVLFGMPAYLVEREMNQLRAQLAEAVKDKERLDWIQSNKAVVSNGTSANHPIETCGFCCLPDWEEGVWGDDYRQAIDAAIEAQKGKQ